MKARKSRVSMWGWRQSVSLLKKKSAISLRQICAMLFGNLVYSPGTDAVGGVCHNHLTIRVIEAGGAADSGAVVSAPAKYGTKLRFYNRCLHHGDKCSD